MGVEWGAGATPLSAEFWFELGKDKAAKGEGWAPPFISYTHDTLGL